MNTLRKSFAISIMMITVLAMSVVVVPTVDAASAGDLIKMDGLSSVYYLAADGKRYVFPNESTYFSWYSDFSSVRTIPQSELESYPLGKNVTVRPGTKLVKITTNPKVYAVEPGGNLIAIPDEATAKALYGDLWNKRIIDVSDAFFTNYTVTGEELTATAYPEGQLVKFGADATIYYIDADGKARAIANEAAFLANRFKWEDIVLSNLTLPALGSPISGSESGMIDTSSGAGGTAGAGTGLTVSISSETPDAGNIPAGSPVGFLTLNFTAANDGDVELRGITLNAYDLGNASYIDSVTWYDSGVKVGTAKNMTSDRYVTHNFATPIIVMAGTTKTLSVRATIEASQTGNFAIGLKASADVITNGAVVSGSFPIVGNTKAIVSGTNIGTVTMTNDSDDQAATAEFGEDNVLLAGFSLSAANEPVIWESAMFYNGGTNNGDIVSNFRLLVDGDEVATANGIVDKYVTFDTGDLLLAKNDTISVEIYGDMGIANDGNTVQLYVKDDTDLSFVGQDFGFGIKLTRATGELDSATAGIKVTLGASDFTIDMDNAATPAKEVRAGDNDVVLATIKMTSNGENATTAYIKDATGDEFVIMGTGLACNEFENVELRDVDSGVTFDVTVASSSTAFYCALTVDEEIAFLKGITRTFQVRADLFGPNDTTPIDENDTLKVILESGAFSITGDESDANITDISPSSVTSAIATVKAASLTWSTVPMTNKTVVKGASEEVIYRATLKTGNSSYIDLTQVKISATSTGVNSFTDTNVASLSLYVDGKLLKTRSGSISEGTASERAFINFTSLDSTNRRIAAGTTVTLEVRANFSSSFTLVGSGLFELGVDATAGSDIVAKDKDDNAVDENSSQADYTVSRAVTLAQTGRIKVELEIDDTKANDDTYLLAGSATTQDRYLGELVFTVQNEDVKVKTLVLENEGTSANDDIALVKLYNESGAVVAEVVPSADGDANFDDFDYVFPADQSTSLFIGVVSKSVNADGDGNGTADHANTIKFSLADDTALDALDVTAGEAVTAMGVDSGEDITLTRAVTDAPGWNYFEKATTTSKTATLGASVLTSVVNTMDDGVLTGGNNKIIGKYKFVFNNGNNRNAANQAAKAQLVQLKFTIATSTGVLVSDIEAYIDGSAAQKTAAVQPDANGIATITGFSTTWADSGLVDGEVTVVLIGDITGVDTSDFVQTELADVAGSGSDITYDGDGETGTATNWSDPLLDIVNVTGATLSN